MSRIAKNPIKISKEIECTFKDGVFSAKGVMTDIDARKQRVGGEIICKVF